MPAQISREKAFLRCPIGARQREAASHHDRVKIRQEGKRKAWLREGEREREREIDREARRARKREREALVGVGGRSNFTRGLTLRRVERVSSPPPPLVQLPLVFQPPARGLGYNEFRDPPCAPANERPRDITLPPHRYGTRTRQVHDNHLDDQVQNVARKGWWWSCASRAHIVLNLLRPELELSLSLCVHPSRNSS